MKDLQGLEAMGTLALRTFLFGMFLGLGAYTLLVLRSNGSQNPGGQFFGEIVKVGWNGQFNLDFLLTLVLVATWILWRHRFSWVGLTCAAGAVIGGMLFVAPYVLVVGARANGEARVLLLGERERNSD